MTANISPGRVKLKACANAFPGSPISNTFLLDQLEKLCDKKTARQARIIAKKLGIQSRYVCRRLDKAYSTPQITSPALSAQAIRRALADCPEVEKLGYLVSHTSTPHSLLPSNAAWISDEMGLETPYMELRQACTGFANALQIAVPMLNYQTDIAPIAIVGSETGSVFFDISNQFIDTEQLINYVQMGDGASAVILDRDDGSQRQIISHCFSGHIGLGKTPGFQLNGAGSAHPRCDKGLPYFLHNAKSVRDQGPALFQQGLSTIQSQGFHLDDFRYIIPHQANGHIDKMLSQHLGIEQERVINDACVLGNLGSTAIWASLTRLIHSDRLNIGDKVLILGAEATKYMYGGFIYQH